MSIQAIVWVLDDSDVDWRLLPVLISLANHTDRDGRAAYPSQDTISRESHRSPASVARDLVKLEEQGLIRRGDQRLVEHLRPDRRPVVYDLITGSQADTPSAATGYQSRSNGVSKRASRVITGDRQTVLEPSLEPSTNDQRPKTGPPIASIAAAFDAFWRVYPRRVGKQAARRAYERALRHADAGVIYRGACRYRDDPNRADQYTAHPTTWLNAGRWDDDPLPQRPARDLEDESPFVCNP